MTPRLWHDEYINQVSIALADVGLDVEELETSDSDTAGLYCYLRGVLVLTPDTSGLDPALWPEGLLLSWEWHPGFEEGEAERGPVWLWGKQTAPRQTEREPAPLPVHGYANPVQVAAAVHDLIATGKPGKPRPGLWDGHEELDRNCGAWAAFEEGDPRR